MQAVLFAFIAFMGWGVGDIFGTTATRKLGGLSTSVWSLIVRVVIFSLFLPFVVTELSNLTLGLLLTILVIAVIGLTGFVTFNEGLKVGNAALVGTIAATFPLVTVVLSVIFLGETLTTRQVMAILVIFSGVIFSSFDFKLLKQKRALHRGVGLALITMLAWGIWFTFIKIPVSKIGWFLPNYIIYASFPLILIFMRLRGVKLVKLNHQNGAIPLILSALLLATAEFSYNFGITKANVSIIAPLAGAYPALFVVLAFIFFKDPIRKQQIFGIVTTLVGIVFLSIFSA